MAKKPADDDEFEARLRVNRRLEAWTEMPADADESLLRETMDDIDQLDNQAEDDGKDD